jgi:hypothetical protein
MKRSTLGLGGAAVALAMAFGVYHHLRGPSGSSVAYGGSIDAAVAPEFPSTAASTWANGAPVTLASLRGSPVLIEAWSPT